jgi:hypothetical protein
MNIKDALKKEPQHIQDSPGVQAMVQVIQSQAEQIQSQAEQIQSQAEQICRLEKTIEDLKDEISRLNKTPKRPKLKPNKMEPRNRGKGNSQGKFSRSANVCAPDKKQEEVRVQAEEVPQGSRFKGYSDFKVQDLEIIVKEITYRLEVWQAPDGKIIRAKLPKELRGKHFGADLRILIINLYAQGLTQPAIYDFLQGIGIDISAGQINHILLEEADEFAKVGESILEAGLNEAPYIRTDDTGARHQHRNGYCTHIGGEYFAYYKTTYSKSRSNFLEILLQDKEGYRINDAMIWHLYQCGVEDDVLNLFEDCKGKKYSSKRGLKSLLTLLKLYGKKLRAQCLEAALVGFISEEILKDGQILLSDRAGQFAVFDHAGCWIHMERPLRKIIPSSEKVKKELERVREAVWELYRMLKESALNQTNRETVEKQYDALLAMKSTSSTINTVIKSFREYREEMLKALDHPGLPLHNNESEGDLRTFVKRRKISGSTKSEKGKKFRDSLATLKQTCFRLGLSFWKYSSLWFREKPPDLAQLVRDHYQAASP